MTSFRFDVGSCNSKSEKIKIELSKYRNVCDQTFISAKAITNSWNDPASQAFFEKVQADELKSSEIYGALEEYQRVLDYFSGEMGNIFSNKGYSANNLVVSFNSNNTARANEYMNYVRSYIRTAQKAFEDCIVPSELQSLTILNEVFNALYNDIGALANAIQTNLNDTCSKIDGLVSTTQAKAGAVEYVSIDDRITQVNANTVYMAPVIAKLEELTDKTGAVGKNIRKTDYVEEEFNDVEKAKVADYSNEIGVDVSLGSTEQVEIIGNTMSTSNVQVDKLETTDTDVSSITNANVDFEQSTLKEAEDVNVDAKIESTDFDVSINKNDETINIDVDAIKTNAQDISLIKNDEDSSISVESLKTSSDIGALNLASGSNVDIDVNTSSVTADTNLTLEKSASVDIDSITQEAKSIGNINIQSGKNVTAEDIMNDAK